MYYDPLRDKTPYGAAASGQPTTFRFTLPSAEKADKVTVILRRGTEEFRADLRFARFDGDGLVYEGGGVRAHRGAVVLPLRERVGGQDDLLRQRQRRLRRGGGVAAGMAVDRDETRV